MTKASEYRQMSDEQLTHELRQLIEELFLSLIHISEPTRPY